MDSENVKEDTKDPQTSSKSEKQVLVMEKSEKSSDVEHENVENSGENANSDEKEILAESISEPIDKENSVSSEQLSAKRKISKGKLNGNKGTCGENSHGSTDEESSKRKKTLKSLSDSEIPECSRTNSDSPFRKLKSGVVKKRYYRSKSSGETDGDTGETSGTQRLNTEEGAGISGSDSDNDSNVSLGTVNFSDFAASSPTTLEDRGADDSNEWTTASEEGPDIAAPVLQKEKPKSKWFAIQELNSRQIGNNPEFSTKFYGSLRAVQRLKLKCKLNEHQGCVNALNFNQKGNLLASASDDLNVNIWDWSTEKKQFTFQTGHKSNVFQAKWLPLDGESLMVTCAHDGQVRLLELPVGKSRRIGSHQGPVHQFAIHKETPHVVLSCGEDGKILSIDIREAKPRKLMNLKEDAHEVQLYSINLHPLNSNEFCVGGRIKTVQVFDRRKISTPLYKLCPSNLNQNKSAHVTSALYNYNGTEILASYNDEDIYLFDTLYPHPSGDFAHKYQGHRNNATVKGVNFFGPRSEYIVSGSDCGNIFIWDKDTESIVQWMMGDFQGVVNYLETHPFVPVLATSGLDYDVKVWTPSSDEPPAMTDLERCVTSNLKNRAEEIDDETDAFDGQMLWILLRRIRQSERFRNLNRVLRRRNMSREGDEDLRESSSDHNSSNNSDSSSEDETSIRPQCSPS